MQSNYQSLLQLDPESNSSYNYQTPEPNYFSNNQANLSSNQLNDPVHFININNPYSNYGKYDLSDSNNTIQNPHRNNPYSSSKSHSTSLDKFDKLSIHSGSRRNNYYYGDSYNSDNSKMKSQQTQYYQSTQFMSSNDLDSTTFSSNYDSLLSDQPTMPITPTVHHNYNRQSSYSNYKSPTSHENMKNMPHTASPYDSKKLMYLKILTTQVVSGTIIGKGGKGLNWFRRKSRVDDILLSMPWEVYPKTDYRTILLKGNIKSLVKAVTMISDLMIQKPESEAVAQHTYQNSFILLVFPIVLLPKIMELKSMYNPKYVTINTYKEPDFNEVLVSIKGDRHFVRNIIYYFIQLIDQIVDIEKYCFVLYKKKRDSESSDQNYTKPSNLNENLDMPQLNRSTSLESFGNIDGGTSHLNLTLKDLAPDDLTSSVLTDDYHQPMDMSNNLSPQILSYNTTRNDSLDDTMTLYPNSSRDGNELFNSTLSLSTSQYPDQSYFNHQISSYYVSLSLTLPPKIDFSSLLSNYPEMSVTEHARDGSYVSVCTFNGPFQDVFSRAYNLISDIHNYMHTI